MRGANALYLSVNSEIKQSSEHAVVFPGQGSQSVGMLKALAEQYPEIIERFKQASDLLDYDLWACAQQGPEAALAETTVTQPLMLTADVALWDVWCQQAPVYPAYMAGHSLGEYSALVASGAMAFETALGAVTVRAKAMAAAVPNGEGGMAAILGLDAQQLQTLCEQASAASGKVVSCVNFNAPGQIVIGGHRVAINEVEVAAKAAGAKRVIPVAMSVPSHCSLMKPAADQLADHLASVPVGLPLMQLLNNARLTIEEDASEIKQALVEQVYCPVNWVGLIESLVEKGVTHIAECGPGKVLSGLNKRIDRQLTVLPLGGLESLEKARAELASLKSSKASA